MKTQKALSDAIQNLPNTFSIQQLAQHANVSDPTARKFCRMQGFSTDSRGLYNKPHNFNPQNLANTKNMKQESPQTLQNPSELPPNVSTNQKIEASQDIYTLAYLKGFDRGFQQGFQTGFHLKDTTK